MSFKLLIRSVALTGPEKFPRKATWVSVFFSQDSPKAAECQSVNYFIEAKIYKLIESAIPHQTLFQHELGYV